MAIPAPTDAELDALAQSYWALLGIDISVLPENDPTAIVDQARCLSNARSTLRAEGPIMDFPGLDPQIEVLYRDFLALAVRLGPVFHPQVLCLNNGIHVASKNLRFQ